jgi:peptidoglycan/LPS O-acetylase OafA/YrhL
MSATPPSAAAQRLPLLDGLRLIAAAAVMLYHVCSTYLVGFAFGRAYLFVDFFFLLSGFVLTLSADTKMARPGGGRAFLRTRIIRLWPTIACGVAVGVAARIAAGQGGDLAPLVLAALLLCPTVTGYTAIFPLNPVHWSLFFEIFANVAQVLVLRRLSDRALLIAIGLFALAFLEAILLVGSDIFGPETSCWWLGFARVLFSYALGMMLARRFRGKQHGGWPRTIAALGLPIAVIVLFEYLPLRTGRGDILIVFLAWPALLWFAAHTAAPGPRPATWCAYAGRLSFPLYAVHYPIIHSVRLAEGWAGGLIGCAVALLVAIAVERITRPGTRVPRAAPILAPA